MGKVFVYRRVSTTEQNLDRQLAGVEADVVLEEKLSARAVDRPKLNSMLELLSNGDEVHVHELSRLARSVKDLTAIIETIASKGATISFHKEKLIFGADSASNPFQSLMLNLLGSISQFERELLLERQREGISIAKQKGVYKGRQSRFTEAEFTQMRDDFKSTNNKSKLARRWGISKSYLYKVASCKC